MTEPDPAFIRSLHELAADVPPPEAVLATVRAGYRHRLRRRRVLATGSVVAVVLLVAGATTVLATRPPQVSHPVNPPVVSATTSSPAGSSDHGEVTTRGATSPGKSPAAASTPGAPLTTPPVNAMRITATPGFGAKNVPPNNPVKVTVHAGKITKLTLTGDDGSQISGQVAPDETSWTNTERLDYNTVYTFAGTATSTNGKPTTISGTISTVKPANTERASIQIPDGGTVGVGAPIIVTFSRGGEEPGGGRGRTQGHHVGRGQTSGQLGLAAGRGHPGPGAYCSPRCTGARRPARSRGRLRTGRPSPRFTSRPTSRASITVAGNGARKISPPTSPSGRSQIVIADASTFHLKVIVNNKPTKDYAVSYGKDSVPGRATLTGIHIVTEKYPTFAMCNPQFDYCNAQEKWAVRINNNGEFIHENLKAAAFFGIANVSHGCINMGEPDAQNYYNSAIYGDPVEVTNTGGPAMTAQDSLYDWIYSPDQWKALSAL